MKFMEEKPEKIGRSFGGNLKRTMLENKRMFERNLFHSLGLITKKISCPNKKKGARNKKMKEW